LLKGRSNSFLFISGDAVASGSQYKRREKREERERERERKRERREKREREREKEMGEEREIMGIGNNN
jgi:hypothetical protein